jgi:hypothetical protein
MNFSLARMSAATSGNASAAARDFASLIQATSCKQAAFKTKKADPRPAILKN